VDTIDGDYIDLDGAGRVDDVMAALNRLFEVPGSAWDDRTAFPLLRLDQGIELVVDYGCHGPESARVAIAVDNGDAGLRRVVAARVFHELAASTPWELRWTSDEEAELVAARTGTVCAPRS
jgi:hypothetical protein